MGLIFIERGRGRSKQDLGRGRRSPRTSIFENSGEIPFEGESCKTLSVNKMMPGRGPYFCCVILYDIVFIAC